MTLDLMQMTHSRAGGNKKIERHTDANHHPSPAKVVLCDIELMIATNLLLSYNIESPHLKAK